MSNTPNLSLPELANSAGNQLNANTTFAMLDALVQTPVISKTLTSAPGSPADGALYIMAAAWAGVKLIDGVTASAAKDLALYRSASGWVAIRPKGGWKFEVAADEVTYRFDGSDWLVWSAVSGVIYSLPIACSGEAGALGPGSAKVTFRMPFAMTSVTVKASLTIAQSSGSVFTVDINENGTSILSTKLTIDNSDTTSATASVPVVVSNPNLASDAEITIDIDQVGDGTAEGLKVYITGLV